MPKFYLILFLLFFSINNVNAIEITAQPALKITTLDGKNFDLKEKRGKVVIINFWAQWCSDCRREMPILEELYLKYKSQGLEIIGVSIDRKSLRQKVLAASSSLSFPNAMIHEASEISFEEPNEIPTSYIIDKNGKIVEKIIGVGDEDVVKKDFEKILKSLF